MSIDIYPPTTTVSASQGILVDGLDDAFIQLRGGILNLKKRQMRPDRACNILISVGRSAIANRA